MRSKTLLGALVACASVLAPASGHTANQFVLNWHTYNHPGSCLGTGLVLEGQANFNVNDFPIPTYTVAGSLVTGPQGSFNQDFRAPFSGALLRPGHNDILFGFLVENLPACVSADETVRLRGPSVDRLLFQLASVGSQYEGATSVDLTLREIDPNLADALANLKRAIADLSAQLRARGTEADETTAALEGLGQELNSLLDEGFDGLTPEELDEMLRRFDGLPASVRDALVAFLRDLQADVGELRAEIQRVAEVFGQRVENVDGVGDGAPGFDPENPGGFEPIATGELPPIDIPAVLGDDPWSDTHDPYADYADEVLATLAPTVSDGAVVQRATFLSIHGAWLYNIQALELILQGRTTVTVREWGAFLNAKGRVLGFLEQYIDHDGWMRDAPISAELKALIAFLKDLDVAYKFKLRAQALQLELNMFTGELTERQQALLDVLLVFDAILRERMTQGAPAEPEDGFWDTMYNVVDTAISFTPVGDFLDLCSAVTGRSGCFRGEPLTLAERGLFALGVVAGSGAAWKLAASKVSGVAVGAIRKVGDVLDEVRINHPGPDNLNFLDPIPHPGGAKTYVHVNGTRVRYDRRGFPNFEPFMFPGPKSQRDVRIQLTGSRRADRALADAKAGWTDATRPAGYVWHHHHDVGRMILVRVDVHAVFPHTGGFALWEKMKNQVYTD
jgi:hypothetical protein